MHMRTMTPGPDPVHRLRRTLALALITAVAATLTGCPSGDSGSPGPSPAASASAPRPAAAPVTDAVRDASSAGAPGGPAPAGTGDATAAPSGATGQAASAAPAADRTGPARLRLEKLSHHFGSMREDEKRSTVIRFWNDGGAPLIIEDIKTTCGCTVPSLAKRRFESGEMGELGITFDPSGPGRDQKKFVTIISNDGGEVASLTQFAVIADVEAFAMVEPRILQLDDMRMGERLTRHLDIGYANASFRIISATASNPYVALAVLPDRLPADQVIERVEAEHGATIRVDISEEAPWGAFFSWIEIKVAGQVEPGRPTQEHVLRLRIQGQVYGLLIAEPDTFRFGVERNTPFTREVVLRHRDGTPFQIVETEVSLPGMDGSSVEVRPTGPGRYTLVLSSPGGAAERNYRGMVTLITDLPGSERSVSLSVIGVVRPTPVGIGK